MHQMPLPLLNETEEDTAKFEILLHLDTGNIIYEKFADLEDLLDFIQEHAHNPAKILERITPKKRNN